MMMIITNIHGNDYKVKFSTWNKKFTFLIFYHEKQERNFTTNNGMKYDDKYEVKLGVLKN